MEPQPTHTTQNNIKTHQNTQNTIKQQKITQNNIKTHQNTLSQNMTHKTITQQIIKKKEEKKNMNSQTLKILEENKIEDKPWDYEDNLPRELREVIIDIEANYRLYPTTYGIIDYLTSNYKQENYDKTYCSKILNLIEIPENVQIHLFPIFETEKTYHEIKHKINDELQQVKLAPLPEQIQSLDQAITESITIEEILTDTKKCNFCDVAYQIIEEEEKKC